MLDGTGQALRQKLREKLPRIFWARITNNFIISCMNDFRVVEPRIECRFLPITRDNCHRVGDFREQNRIPEYMDKLVKGEIGFFAEHKGAMIGSIWASINKTAAPTVKRTCMKLMPNEGLIHDIVTAESSRGMGVGAFMVSRIAPLLLKEYGLSRIIIDVSIRNRASLRMIGKMGLRVDSKVLYVIAFGRLLLQKELKKYDYCEANTRCPQN